MKDLENRSEIDIKKIKNFIKELPFFINLSSKKFNSNLNLIDLICPYLELKILYSNEIIYKSKQKKIIKINFLVIFYNFILF